MRSRSKTVLIVHADEAEQERLTGALRRDFRILCAASGEAAVASLTREDVDIVVTDARLPGISGLELVRIARQNFAAIEIVLLSDASDRPTAVQARGDGAYQVVPRGEPTDALADALRHASEQQDLRRQVSGLTEQIKERAPEFVTGASVVMREVMRLARKVAPGDSTVLLLGESGTGKELLARMIHRESGRDESSFVAVNLAAIPPELVESTLFGHEKGAFTGAVSQRIGKFELASGGTLFLDEVGDLRLDLQAKLLRALQEDEIERVGGQKPIKTDCRLIAATNVDLDKAVKQGTFRSDLYYRLNVIPIRMPALRERIEDLPEFVGFFLRHYNQKHHRSIQGVADAAMKMLAAYWWPGNIRELQNLIERLVAVTDKPQIEDTDLPFEFHFAKLDATASSEGLLQRACDTFERNFILKALEKSSWKVAATARYLGIPLSTMKYKLERLEIRELAKRLRGT